MEVSAKDQNVMRGFLVDLIAPHRGMEEAHYYSNVLVEAAVNEKCAAAVDQILKLCDFALNSNEGLEERAKIVRGLVYRVTGTDEIEEVVAIAQRKFDRIIVPDSEIKKLDWLDNCPDLARFFDLFDSEPDRY